MRQACRIEIPGLAYRPKFLQSYRKAKWKEARDLLAEVSAWFTEGFDTADLQETKALREELAYRRRHVPARARRTLTAEGGQGAWLRSDLALPSPCTCSAHPGCVHPTVTLLARGRTVPSIISLAPA
jgi:hypothetical protein